MKIFQNENEEKSNLVIFYEILMVVLAALSVGTLWFTTGVNDYIIWGTWAIFFIDFSVRIFKSDNKWEFIKANPFIVIAAIPLDAIFQLARFARLLHLLRLKTITKYYTMPFIRLLKDQKLYIVFAGAFAAVFVMIIPLYLVEPALDNYWEAFANSLLSVIVFYGTGFEPATMIGNVITVILTILGVMLHGVVISTAFEFIYRSSWFQRVWGKIKAKRSS